MTDTAPGTLPTGIHWQATASRESAGTRRRVPTHRVALLVPAAFALLTGLDAGLLRLGLPAPVDSPRLSDVHGLVVVFGFVGTLVALERAVALGAGWGFLAPAGLACAGILLIAPAPRAAPAFALIVGSGALLALYVPLWRRQAADDVLAQVLGAALGLGACLLWAGGVAVPVLLPWLAAFLVLTIAGERLELSRLTLSRRAELTILGWCVAFAVAVPLTLLWPRAGAPILGLAVVGLAAWLAAHDVARRTIRTHGLPRFAAFCLLTGYAWLAVAGLSWLLAGPVTEGPRYDATIHAVFLGFVISMIMAHAPVILPAVLRRPLPYRSTMYGPVVILHATLLLRVAVGDAHQVAWAWQVGGAGNVVAVLAFLGVAAHAGLTAPKRAPAAPMSETGDDIGVVPLAARDDGGAASAAAPDATEVAR